MQELIPVVAGAQSAPTAQQKQHKTTLVDAAKLLNQIGWGNQGDIAGVEEDVPIRELWLNPFNPVTYTDAQVRQMTTSLQTMQQIQPITVAYIESPGVDDDGIPRGHLMVVDGKLRFLGACSADWNHLRAVVKSYHSMAEVMLEYTTIKFSTRPLSGLNRGRLIKQTRYVYDTESDQFSSNGRDHPMKRAFTQQELAKRWACSQASISNWEALASQPDEIVGYLEDERVTDEQVLWAIRTGQDEDERLGLVRQMIAANEPVDALGPPKKKREPAIRLLSDTKPKPKASKPIDFKAEPLPFSSLWSVEIGEETSPLIALGCLLHDVREILGIMHAGKRHPTLKRLADVMSDEAITQFISEVEQTV